LALVVVCGLPYGVSAWGEPVRTNYSTAELVAEQATIPADGGTVTVGLRLAPDPMWHAYWINPGDAGLPATMRWNLPAGLSASELRFPAPHVIPFGELVTYGFDEPILLLSEIEVPAGQAGAAVTLRGEARWVVCDDELCVPERASLSLTLPYGDGDLDPRTAESFAAARAKLPEVVDWPAQFEHVGESLNVSVKSPESIAEMRDPYLFVESRYIVRYAQQSASFAPGGVVVSLEAGRKAAEATEFRAVLRFVDSAGDERFAWVDVGQASDAAPPVAGGTAVPLQAAPLGGISLPTAFLFAFIGGVILNLMPCVFPVLSMKALSLVRMGHTDRRETQQSGLLYTAGILVAFAVAGTILVVVREAGQAVGWGVQMQFPLVNLGLALLMVAIALNLLGVFEFGVRAAGVGQSLTAGSERRAAFFTGLLAVVVATPCTAPFMAGALGYALVQPVPVALGIFLALGLGLALPYLLISFVPSLGRIMPRPGAWMATFRSILAFPMLATAVWLLWILGRQLGASSMAVGLLTAVFFAFSLWAYGRVFGSPRPWPWRGVAAAALVATLVTGAKVEEYGMDPATFAQGQTGTLGGLSVERFTPDRVAGYVESGQPVFVYFTADWCVNCKVNERVALASEKVGMAFKERGIKILEGDWTNQDPVITEWLHRHGRVGVPLYQYFPEGASIAKPAVLPQVLFPDIVIAAIDAADGEAVIAAEPDWSVVQAYIAVDEAWHALDDEIRKSDASPEEKRERRTAERGEHPDISRAVAAASAILDLDGAHERTRDAAVFMMEHTMGLPGSTELVVRGARVIAEHFPEDDDWARLLWMLDFNTQPGEDEEVEAIFERLSGSATDAVTRATAAYYRAARYLRIANQVSTASEDREPYRERALAIAAGLSAGVEDAELEKRRRFDDDGTPIPFQTLAQAERDLLYNLNHLTVGRKLPNVTARRLDGVEEDFSALGNQTVLIDFWATWCGPCVKSLPDLRELSAQLPADSFEILSISVDEEIDTVTEFQSTEPMPWANWHIGPRHEILQTWAVRGYPTYVLVDAVGNIAARQHELDDTFISLIRSTARAGT
jgi:thiol:disulfide interchange protein DsbD